MCGMGFLLSDSANYRIQAVRFVYVSLNYSSSIVLGHISGPAGFTRLPQRKGVVERRPNKRDVPTVRVAFGQPQRKASPTQPMEARQQFLPRLEHRMRRKQQVERYT